MANELVPFADIERMAKVLGGGMFGKTPEQMLALMLIAQAEGLHPARAAQDYDVIKGRPAINSKAALSRFQSAGGKVRWIERTDQKASAEFSHPSGGVLTVEWTMARAKTAGYTDKENRDGSPNMWQRIPAQMLSARVVAEGVRAVYPACLSGLYSVEEVQDMEPRNGHADPVNVTPPKADLPKAEPPAEDSEEYKRLMLLIESADGQVDGSKLDALREAAHKHRAFADHAWCARAMEKLSAEMDRQEAILAANAKPEGNLNVETGERETVADPAQKKLDIF